MGTDVGGEHVCVLLGLLIVAIQGRTHGNEGQVVTVEHHGINALQTACLQVRTVDRGRFLVGFHCGCIISGAEVNMGRHVDNVSRSRGQRRHLVCTSQGALRIRPGLNSTNVVVDGTQMIGIAPHDGFKRGHDFLRAGFGRAILMPQAPGMQVHSRLRE